MIPSEECAIYGNPDAREDYRYWLHRDFGTGQGNVLFIMLNPSDALSLGNPDVAADNDPTVARCIEFARLWEYQDLTVVNLFAFRTSVPEELLNDTAGRIGEHNDAAIEWATQSIQSVNGRVVCAWGDHGGLHCRNCRILDQLAALNIGPYCLGLTKWRQPKHPRVVGYDTELRELPPIR